MLMITDIIILNEISKGEFKKEKNECQAYFKAFQCLKAGWGEEASKQKREIMREKSNQECAVRGTTEEDVQYALTLGIKIVALSWKALLSLIYCFTPSLPCHINIEPFLTTLLKFGFTNPDSLPSYSLFLCFILLM